MDLILCNRVLHQVWCQAYININLMCSRIYDAFDLKPITVSSVFRVQVYYFI